MSAFKLFIGNVEVSRYVHSDTLEEYVQTVEGDEIWSYYLDNLSFSLDKSVCDLFADVDVDNTHLFNNKTVELYYYGNLVFGGVIGSKIGFDYRDTIDIEAASYGRIVADLEISQFRNFGNVLRDVIYRYLYTVNTLLTEQNYPFILYNNYFENPINITEFFSLKSFTISTVVTPFLGGAQIMQKSPGGGGEGIPMGYYVFSTSGWLNDISIGYRLTETGIKETETISVNNEDRVYYRIINEIEDTSVINHLKNVYGEGGGLFSNSAVISNSFYVIRSGGYLIKIIKVKNDKYVFDYKNVISKDIQKDFGIVTNSITWVGVDKKMYFQNRDGISGLSVKNVYDMTSETLVKTSELSVSDGLWKHILDDIKDDIHTYYSDYFLGTFIKYKLLISRKEFTEDEYPLKAKRLKVWQNNKIVDCGIIKEATFRENTIEIVAERRIE